jgi:predicted kinase
LTGGGRDEPRARPADDRVTADTPARPTVYLLCGFVSSGKTTYARQLERSGVVRLSIDEWIFERYGRHGIDYPESQYPEHEAEARRALDTRLTELLAAKRSVVLDYGLWSRSDRDRYKRLVDQHGGTWRLLYFRISERLARERLGRRNTRRDANALTVNERHFAEFRSRFHPPFGEGEEYVDQE